MNKTSAGIKLTKEDIGDERSIWIDVDGIKVHLFLGDYNKSATFWLSRTKNNSTKVKKQTFIYG